MWIHIITTRLIEGAGAVIIPPTPAPRPDGGGRGKGGKRRRYIRLSNGQTLEVRSEEDIRRVVEDLIERKNAESVPQKKRKTSKKIRPRVKAAGLLQNFASFDTLYAELALLEAQIVEERFLLDLILAILAREQIRQDDEEVLLLVEMMT